MHGPDRGPFSSTGVKPAADVAEEGVVSQHKGVKTYADGG
jgi:hypothetical protein